MKSPILIAFVLIVGVGSQAGCFKFFQTVYVPAMDADAESFVYVEQAHGNVLTLRGGGTVTIDELSVEGLSEFQLKMCGQYLARVSRYPESASQVNLPHNGLLIRETESSKKALLSVPFCDIRLHSCGFRPINIFPIRKEIPPEHVDIVECILLAGLGKCNLFVIEDPIRRERYLKAQKYAETMSLGVWASLGEQLLQAVAAGDVDEIERLLDDGASLG
ncbi:MAG TPA: hypothetical protein ENL03_01095, partial [Phycisphaerae bacterium]|nr:hypothetical protein [Phycisphaerae bacterium]